MEPSLTAAEIRFLILLVFFFLAVGIWFDLLIERLYARFMRWHRDRVNKKLREIGAKELPEDYRYL